MKITYFVFFVGIFFGASNVHGGETVSLLNILDEKQFWWSGDDEKQEDELRSLIEEKGVFGLFSSNRWVLLDAETLAEDGLIDAILEIGSQLRHRGVSIRSISVIENDGSNYTIEVNGTTYTAYTSEQVDDSWRFATETFFRIVDDLLPAGSNDRFYALYSGNDLSGFFLPPEVIPFFAEAGMDKSELPYLPSREAPWYGMEHND
ncbi:MAG: hypothetical protein GXP03_02575 [Alphaproteobacteria bacterium]|nr:hypothetical protein [Alphaproteobacteria bacterium]